MSFTSRGSIRCQILMDQSVHLSFFSLNKYSQMLVLKKIGELTTHRFIFQIFIFESSPFTDKEEKLGMRQ